MGSLRCNKFQMDTTVKLYCLEEIVVTVLFFRKKKHSSTVGMCKTIKYVLIYMSPNGNDSLSALIVIKPLKWDYINANVSSFLWGQPFIYGFPSISPSLLTFFLYNPKYIKESEVAYHIRQKGCIIVFGNCMKMSDPRL